MVHMLTQPWELGELSVVLSLCSGDYGELELRTSLGLSIKLTYILYKTRRKHIWHMSSLHRGQIMAIDIIWVSGNVWIHELFIHTHMYMYMYPHAPTYTCPHIYTTTSCCSPSPSRYLLMLWICNKIMRGSHISTPQAEAVCSWKGRQ